MLISDNIIPLIKLIRFSSAEKCRRDNSYNKENHVRCIEEIDELVDMCLEDLIGLCANGPMTGTDALLGALQTNVAPRSETVRDQSVSLIGVSFAERLLIKGFQKMQLQLRERPTRRQMILILNSKCW